MLSYNYTREHFANNVIEITDSEGAGGAGAGGSVILRVSNYSSDLYVNTRGGIGGSIESTIWAGTCHGPGGGGGGGYLGISLPALPANVFLDNALLFDGNLWNVVNNWDSFSLATCLGLNYPYIILRTFMFLLVKLGIKISEGLKEQKIPMMEAKTVQGDEPVKQ